jgi:hypothetical protein
MHVSNHKPEVSSFDKISLFLKKKVFNIFNIHSEYANISSTNLTDKMNASIPIINIEDVKILKNSNDSCGSIEIIDKVLTENSLTADNSLNNNTNNTNNTNNNYYTHIDSIINDECENNCYTMINENDSYDDMTISTVIDNIIDNIITQHFIDKNHHNDTKTTLFSIDYYKEQLLYESCKNIMNYSTYKDMCRYITGIINLDFIVMDKLRNIKSYDCNYHKNNMYLGVFKTDNFIIKIDNIIDSFTSDLCVMNFLGKGVNHEHNIVLPYYVKLCSNGNSKTNMNFSIQPRIRNTLTLHDWISIYDNRKLDTSVYIKMCISISKSILYLHSNHIVHGDIKPMNILIENITNNTYIIDFGLSGLHKLSDGTGGTKPFCSPDTTNVFNDNEEKYVWTKNDKYYDLWSIAFMFASIIIFRKCYSRYVNYPRDFFDTDKYINSYYLHHISPQYRTAFMCVLCKDKYKSVNLENFIRLLETSIQN